MSAPGVICFISNYSWLDGLSFTGMRERYLDAFDAVRIDCLNGDKYKTGKVSPDGLPDPSIFSTEGAPVGIQVGTAITTLVRKSDHAPARRCRELPASLGAGQTRRTDQRRRNWSLARSTRRLIRFCRFGLPFVRTTVSEHWFDWPALPDLFPVSFPGVKSPGATVSSSILTSTGLGRASPITSTQA